MFSGSIWTSSLISFNFLSTFAVWFLRVIGFLWGWRTLRTPENWGVSACNSLMEQDWTLLCRRGMGELPSRGEIGEKASHLHTLPQARERVWRRQRKMRLIILPVENQEYPVALYTAACHDVLPSEKRRNTEKMRRERRNMMEETRRQILNYTPVSASL